MQLTMSGDQKARSQHVQTKKKIVVFGASGHAKVILDIVRRQGTFEVVGLLDEHKQPGFVCSGHEVLGTTQDLPDLINRHSISGAIVAIGDNWVRARVVNEIRARCPEVEFVTAIHPAAVVACDVPVSEGTVIMAGAVVSPGARIGEFCILNTRSSLDHDSEMDSYSSLGPAAVTGGAVRIGAFSHIAIGATLVQDVVIGQHTVIGAGAVVFKSMPDEVVAYGTPARVVRPRKPGDRYLAEATVPNGERSASDL